MHVCIYVRVCWCVCMWLRIYVCEGVCISVCVVFILVPVHLYEKYTRTWIHTLVFTHMSLDMYMYTHMCTHTNTFYPDRFWIYYRWMKHELKCWRSPRGISGSMISYLQWPCRVYLALFRWYSWSLACSVGHPFCKLCYVLLFASCCTVEGVALRFTTLSVCIRYKVYSLQSPRVSPKLTQRGQVTIQEWKQASLTCPEKRTKNGGAATGIC